MLCAYNVIDAHRPLTNQQKTDTIIQIMKTNLHPTNYRPVVFSDEAAGFKFLTRSTAPTSETIKWEDGNTYPLVKVPISSASHPFFTGEEKIIDTEGRVDRFKAKAATAKAHKAELINKAKKVAKDQPAKKTE
jgi:large subunit ribosomal protein L31